ncbi:MAG: PQQ-dependent sugar dehydrogenase [Gammaproteobacteria bacterium]
MRLAVRHLPLIFVFALAPPIVSAASPCADPAANTIPDIALTEVASGFKYPVHASGDGGGRLFVVEQPGVIRAVENGKAATQPFLDIRHKVESGGEKGLLSIAFHPKYKTNGFFFLNYTTRSGGQLYTIVSRWKRGAAGRGDPASEQVLLKIEQPYSNHNGGQLAFGHDGYLYIGMGDGGSGDDPRNHGQNLATLLGKMLRIDVDRPAAGKPYGIPADNPFLDRRDTPPEIYAYGLRNPWRFSFDAGNGRLYLADVGQNVKEEIDVIEKGGNYGWRVMEADICTPGVNKRCTPIGILPIYSYFQSEGRSVTGGFVYRGSRYPALCGTYLYGDYVSGNIWGLRYDGRKVTTQRRLLDTNHNISSFGQGDDLELYVVDHGGRVLRIGAPANAASR